MKENETMKIRQELIDKTDAIQKECHDHINEYYPKLDKRNIEYQDLVNGWTFMKLAELQLKIEKLERVNTVIG